MSLYFALTIIKEVIDIGPKYTEKTKYVSYNYFVSLIINVVSMYLFIVFWGIEGVIYSMILTYLMLVVISWIVSNKLYYIPFSKILFCNIDIACIEHFYVCNELQYDSYDSIYHINIGSCVFME